MYENSDKPVDFSKKPHNVPRKLQSNVYKEITNRELGFNLGRSNHEIEAVAEDKLVTKNYLEMRCELPGQTRSTFLMVFSPDGKKVASTHGNHNVYVTDLTTGKNINTLSGHPRTPWCIAFHPSSNQILATGCLGGQVRVWDLHGGSEVWMAEGQTVIASLAFHPTDRMLVIATYNELHFWDWSQSAPFAKCYTNNEKEKVRYVAFDPLGHKLITGISNVPPHSTQWDRSSAGSHHLSHHHHLYHHQPFQRTSGRYHPVPCTHYQQSTNVPGQRTEEQLETDGRVNDGNPHLSSQREGRTQSGSREATSSSTSSSYQMPDYERRISVCYRSLAQRYEQLLQRYFDLVRPRYVDTTDRGTDPMEAEETSGSSGNAVIAESTNQCTCNNPATNTDNNWTVGNRSGTSASASNTRARNSTRGFSTAINSSSTSSASIVNGTQTANSHARSNSCPCFGNVSMCRRICQSSSSSSLGIHNHIPAASGVSSALTSVASSSTNCANMPSGSHQTSPRATCPSNTGIVSSEVSNCEPEGHPSQSANCSSVNFSSHKSSDAAHTPNENSLHSPARTPAESTTTVTPCNRMEIDHNSLPSPTIRPAESTTTVTESNRMEIEQAENTRLGDPSSAEAASISPDMDDQNNSGQCSLGPQQDDLQPQAQSTISNNQEQHVGTEQGTISQRDEHQQPRGSASQTSTDVAATSTRHRDLRRLRNGINILNHQIDSIQRLCRARMEILQLQHVRRVWGSLQCQINSLQGAVNQMSQSDSSGPDTTEEDQPAQVPNVSQLLELARISDGEPADECSELHASSSSSDDRSVVIRESDQSVTEETASVQATQDWTDDGERPVKRARIDPQSSSVTTQNKLNTDGAGVSSKVSHTVSELATGNADPSITDEEHKHGNISGRNKLERDAGSSGSKDAASHERQGHSTEVKIEKLVGHNLPVAGLMTASCSGASSASQNSDCVAGPSKISRAARLSSVYSSGGRAGRNIGDISSRICQSHQELLNEMQNLRATQERSSQSSIADRQAGVRPETESVSFWKLCARHGAKVARAGTCNNCGSCHPNTATLNSNSPRLQPTTMHIGSNLPQPRPIYTSVRPQELVATSHSGPTNLVPHESVSSLQETHSEMCMSNCSNVKGEETSCVTKSVSSSKEMTNNPVRERKVDDTKNISSLVSTCMANASNRTSEEPGENSASSQHDNSKEQEIPTQKSRCGEVTHSQNQVTDGVSNSVTNETVSKGDSVSLSNMIAEALEEYHCTTSAINAINKQNPSCSHSDANTTQNVENNSVEANPCSPAGNPADLLSETAAYPANVHPFIPGVVTNFCGNIGEQSSHSLYAQQNTHLSSAPEDLRSHERRAANSGDQLAQVNPSCPQNDNVHGNECTSSNLHFDSSADTRGTFSHSSRRSDGTVSHSERSSNAPRSDSDQIPIPSIIPRQGPLMSPWPDPLLVPRPGSLPTPRASPLLVPGSVQESPRCPRVLHVGGRYYVPRPRFHQRSGHCSRGRTLSRPPTRAELLGRPYFLQTLAETYHCLTGNSIERSNEIIRQMEANSRNRLSRPTASCTIQTQQRGSSGNCNQCADNRDPRLRWRQSAESSNDSSENASQPSSSNHNDTVFESRVETAVNMTKGQALNCTLETSEQSGESSSSNQSASVTSDQFVAPGNKDCAQLPEVEVKLPDDPSDLASGESSTGIKQACASDNTVSQPVAEVTCSSLSSASGNNDSAPFCVPSDPATVKDATHSISQNVGYKPGQSTAVTESAPSSCSHSDNANISSQATAPNEGGVTENVPQSTVEARPSQSSSEGNTDVSVSQPQESGGRSAATQTPGPPLRRPDSVGASRGLDPPASQNGVRLQLPRNGTSRTVRDIFGRLQRLLDYERMYRQTVMDATSPTNQLPTRRSSGPFNTTPAHSNTATDVWGRWTRRPSDILSERLAEHEISFSGQAARVAAERLITALQTELCETERLHQRLANSPRPSASPGQTAGELSQETTRQRARQVLCVMVESLTQVFEENDPFHNFSRDVSDSRVRLFLSDLYFLLQLALELVDLLLIQISRPWRGVGAQLQNGVESTSNSRHYTRDQISHPRPRGTGSFRFYARRGSSTHRPSDGYSRQLSAGASGTVHTSPVRTLSRHRTGRPLGRGSWVHRFFGASTRFLPGMMQGTRGTDAALPQVCEVSPADRDGHVDSERGGPISRSSRLPSSTRGVRGRFQRGSSTCHHGHQERHSHLFHNFHNYCRQPEEEVQEQQQQSQPSRHLSHHSQQQHQNSQELEEQQQQQQQQQPSPEEGQQPQLLSSDSGQQGQSRQQQEHLEEQPQDGGHVQERNSEYRSEHSQNQRESNNQSLTSTISQILSSAIQMGQQEVDNTDLQRLSSAIQRRQQAQRNADTFAVPAVQLNDVPIADVGQLSQIEPPHIRPQSPPANPFGVVSRQSHQMLGGLPPSERWLVNFDEVYPNTGVMNSTTAGRQFTQYPFMGLVQGSLSESSNRRSTSNFPGSSRGPINNSTSINDGHIHRPQSDTESWTYGAPTGWRSRFLHPRYVGPNMFNDESFASIENYSFIRGPDTVIITDAPLSPNHRIQAWDISKFNIPDISNAEKNIIVSECKIHNDASVDVSKDGTLLVTLLPSNRICVTTMLGIYSLEWESLGQCLYTTSFEQNAVSVSLSPACRHLLVGLASRRIVLPTDRPTVAQIFRMEGAKPGRSVGGRGRLCHLRDIEHNRENSFTSLNCIRWAPEPGQGLVYGTNTGTLRVLR